MQPEFQINFLAVLACAFAAMPIGFAWFGPVFGKAWAREMGMDDIPTPSGAAMAKSMGLHFVGNLLISFVLARNILVWQPAIWGVGENQGMHVYALNGAMWTWLGFFLPAQIGRVAWEFKRWKLVAINSAHDLTRLLTFSFILAYWP